MTWLKFLVSQSPMPSFWSRDSRIVICKMILYKSHFSESSVFKVFHPSRLSLLLPQCDWQVRSNWNRQCGASSSTAQPGTSKPCCFLKGTCINLFPWLIWCTSERNTAMSRSCSIYWNMKSAARRVSETSKLWSFWSVSKVNLPSRPCYLCFWSSKETAANYNSATSHSQLSSEWGETITNEGHGWTPAKYCFFHYT